MHIKRKNEIVGGLMSKAVLLVEDVAVTAMAIADALGDAGYRIIGPFASAGEAVASLRTEHPDYAILDVSIRGGTSVEVARELRIRSIPFLVHTGWAPTTDSPEEFKEAPWLEKPVTYERLLQALSGLDRNRRRPPAPARRGPPVAPCSCQAAGA
jgi:CheY-like chemotaxis protein